MRSSDWSSDVCSSDLPATAPAIRDRSHAMSNDTETAARALVEATRSGKLGDAYRVLDKRPVDEVQAIALQAGFSRSEEHTSELQSLMRISYAVFCLKKKTYTDYHAPSKSTELCRKSRKIG